MCCRRNGPRPQPPAVTLGKFLYQKYQERKQQQQMLGAGPAYNDQRRSSPPPEVLEREANGEILEKIQPPSYDFAVNGTDRSSAAKLKRSASNSSGDLSDDDSFFELDSDGERQLNSEMSAAQADFVAKWRARRGSGGEAAPQLTRMQQRRAEKAIQRAEKAARKADRLALGL